MKPLRCAILFLLPAALALPARAGEWSRFLEGVRAYARGDYAAATNAWRRAAETAPRSAETRFNLGDAAFRLGDYALAAEAFRRAAELASDDAFRARCRYNLGNTLLRLSGEAARKKDLRAAVSLAEEAARSFRLAALDDPAFTNAAYNLEISLRLLHDLRARLAEEEKRRNGQKKKSSGKSGADQDTDNADADEGMLDADNGELRDGEPLGDFSRYQEIRGMPPPARTESDILAEEARHRQERRQRRAASCPKVEKDW